MQITAEQLEKFNLVSIRNKTIPNGGSPCYNVSKLNLSDVINHTKKVKEDNISLIIYTDVGVLRFWKELTV